MAARKRKLAALLDDDPSTDCPVVLDGPLDAVRLEFKAIADRIAVEGDNQEWRSPPQCMVERARAAVAAWTSSPAKLMFGLHDDPASCFSDLCRTTSDRVLASVLGATGLLDVYVAKLEMTRRGRCSKSPAQLHLSKATLHKYWEFHTPAWANHAFIRTVSSETVVMTGIRDAHNNRTPLQVDVDLGTEFVQGGDLFADTKHPIRHKVKVHRNVPHVEMAFRRHVLVVWPRDRSFEAAGFLPGVARALVDANAGDLDGPRAALDAMVMHATTINMVELARALELATTISANDELVLALCRLWAKTPPSYELAYDYANETALVAALRKALYTTVDPALLDVVVSSVLPKLRAHSVVHLASEYRAGANALVAAVLARKNNVDTWSSEMLCTLYNLCVAHVLNDDDVFELLLSRMRRVDSTLKLATIAALAVRHPTRLTGPLLASLLHRHDHDAANAIAAVAHASLALPDLAPMVVNTVIEVCTHVQDALLPSLLARLDKDKESVHARRLCAHRLRLLPVRADGPPNVASSWCQPYATLPLHPGAQAFFRGPHRVLLYKVRGGTAAVSALRLRFRCDGSYSTTSHASAIADTAGARVHFEKTNAFRAMVVPQWERYCDEADALRTTFGMHDV